MALRLYIAGILIVPRFLVAQEPYIFSNDKYSGISAVGISPTQPFLNPNGWDVHLFSDDVFFQSDYIYISRTSLLGLLKGDIGEADPSNGITGENTGRITDYYNKDITGYHFSNEIMGPSVSLNFNLLEHPFSAGLFTKLRTQSSTIEVDNYLQFTNQEIDEPVLYNLGPFRTNFMNWNEIGLNLSTQVFTYSDFEWIVGANIKYEIGLDAAYVNNKEDALMRREYEENPENPNQEIKSLYISNFDIEVGYATNYNFDTDSYRYNALGKGVGLDAGITMMKQQDRSEDYDLKISFNILDIGYVNFNGTVHRFQGENLKYVNNPVFDNAEFESPEQYAEIISNELYGNPDQSKTSNKFTVGLPTSVHINASKNIGENQFLNLNVIQRSPVFRNSLKRSNIMNVSYSVQRPGLGYGGSISAYDYKNVQLGGFLRWGPLLIGSENILPIFFNHKKLHGMDFYIGLKLYPMWDNEMKRRSREECKC